MGSQLRHDEPWRLRAALDLQLDPLPAPSPNSTLSRARASPNPSRIASQHPRAPIAHLCSVAPHSRHFTASTRRFGSYSYRLLWLTLPSRRATKVCPVIARLAFHHVPELQLRLPDVSARLRPILTRNPPGRNLAWTVLTNVFYPASWQWGSGRPSGEVAEVKEHGDLSIQSNKGNTITKNATPDDPAVHLAREGNDVVKRAHELTVDKEANGTDAKAPEPEKTEAPKETGAEKANGASEAAEPKTTEATNGEAKAAEPETGDKRKATEPAVAENGADEEDAPKKAKTNGDADADDKKSKARGRPKKADGEKKAPAKKRAPKKAATESGEPRRSGRNRS